jgi:hypothetical protein
LQCAECFDGQTADPDRSLRLPVSGALNLSCYRLRP